MASFIKNGESIFIPFRNGQSISDSQLKPRMYKTVQSFIKSLSIAKGCPSHILNNIRQEKATERGRFNKKIMLLSVEED